LWISLAIAVVINVVLSAVVITQLKNDKSDTPTQAAPSPTTQSAPQPSGTQQPPNGAAGQSMTCEGFTASVDAHSQPGWHATIDRRSLAYAVPPDWKVEACGVRMGWAKPCPDGQCVIREIGAVSTIANPACAKQNLAMAGIPESKNPDLRAALEEESTSVVTIYAQDGRVPNVEGSVVFLISLRQGANATPKPGVINEIVKTLRSPA
jgi:hypothetical protein